MPLELGQWRKDEFAKMSDDELMRKAVTFFGQEFRYFAFDSQSLLKTLVDRGLLTEKGKDIFARSVYNVVRKEAEDVIAFCVKEEMP